jgi:ribosomal protein L9
MADEKKSAEAVKREVDQLKRQIEVLKAQEQGQAFASLDEDQLTKKVKGVTPARSDEF